MLPLQLQPLFLPAYKLCQLLVLAVQCVSERFDLACLLVDGVLLLVQLRAQTLVGLTESLDSPVAVFKLLVHLVVLSPEAVQLLHCCRWDFMLALQDKELELKYFEPAVHFMSKRVDPGLHSRDFVGLRLYLGTSMSISMMSWLI